MPKFSAAVPGTLKLPKKRKRRQKHLCLIFISFKILEAKNYPVFKSLPTSLGLECSLFRLAKIPFGRTLVKMTPTESPMICPPRTSRSCFEDFLVWAKTQFLPQVAWNRTAPPIHSPRYFVFPSFYLVPHFLCISLYCHLFNFPFVAIFYRTILL